MSALCPLNNADSSPFFGSLRTTYSRRGEDHTFDCRSVYTVVYRKYNEEYFPWRNALPGSSSRVVNQTKFANRVVFRGRVIRVIYPDISINRTLKKSLTDILRKRSFCGQSIHFGTLFFNRSADQHLSCTESGCAQHCSYLNSAGEGKGYRMEHQSSDDQAIFAHTFVCSAAGG